MVESYRDRLNKFLEDRKKRVMNKLEVPHESIDSFRAIASDLIRQRLSEFEHAGELKRKVTDDDIGNAVRNMYLQPAHGNMSNDDMKELLQMGNNIDEIARRLAGLTDGER